MKVGQRVIYYRRGKNHVRSMDKYIGKILTISDLHYHTSGELLYARMKESYEGWYFNIDALKPIASKIR